MDVESAIVQRATDHEDSGSEMDGDGDMNDVDQAEDDQEWQGIGTNAATPEEHFSGKKPTKPPTGEELRAIKDASDLFKSSAFKLQVLVLSFLMTCACLTVLD